MHEAGTSSSAVKTAYDYASGSKGSSSSLNLDGNKGAEIVLDMERVRDAAMMLSHQRPHREYPLQWVEKTIAKKGMVVVASQ